MKFTARQVEANKLLGGPATHVLLDGGSRSGKTFLILRAIAARSIKAAGARHAVLRFRFNHLRASILSDTWPKMLDLCWPGLRATLKDDKHDWYTTFPNGSQVWWGGLDDKDRAEKVLGQEHAGVYLNECSQISWPSRGLAVTRLAQQVKETEGPHKGRDLKARMYYDANPPSKGHWLHRVFYDRKDPRTGQALSHPERYAKLSMNPIDNVENLAGDYLDELAALPKHMRDRFLHGLYAEENPNALFSSDWFEKWRHSGALPKMQRIVVAVDPSGASDEDEREADDIGIVVAGLGVDGNGYLLEDLTINAGPGTWGKVAAQAARRHGADAVIGERNYGGDMVKFVIRTAQRELGVHVSYREVVATRGKVIRAEPVSALYEQGLVRHVGEFRELEQELCGFSTTGYTGGDSPNRADAVIWAWTELFPGLTVRREEHEGIRTTSDGYEYDDGYDDAAGWKVA